MNGGGGGYLAQHEMMGYKLYAKMIVYSRTYFALPPKCFCKICPQNDIF